MGRLILTIAISAIILLFAVSTYPRPCSPHGGASPLLDTTLFDNGIWAISGGSDTGPNPRDISVSVRGQYAGDFSELNICHFTPTLGFPQVFSVKGNGALRAVLPQGEWGATFYSTGYWDRHSGFVQTMPIIELDIQLDTEDTTVLQLAGHATNLESFEASDFTINIHTPSFDSVRVDISYNLVATDDFHVDMVKQAEHQGFRLARIASNFISAEIHDSDQAKYIDTAGLELCVDLVNGTGFIFSSTPFLLPMGEPELYLAHADTLPRRTPTLIIRFTKPAPKYITPQGYVTFATDPSSDNVDLWGNWDGADSIYYAGDTIGNFCYTLLAVPPGVNTGIPGTPEENADLLDYSLAQNYPNPFNPSTIISYQLAKVSDVEITIYNILGQRVRKLVKGKQCAGSYKIQWDSKNDNGVQLANGIYLLRLNAGSFVRTRKMMLVR